MYLSSADLLSIQFRVVSSYTKDLKKPLNSQGGEHLREDGRLPRTIQYYFYSGILTQVQQVYNRCIPAWRVVVLHIDIILHHCVNNYPQGGT